MKYEEGMRLRTDGPVGPVHVHNARKLIGALQNQMKAGGLDTGVKRVTRDGVWYEVKSLYGQVEAKIIAPVEAPKPIIPKWVKREMYSPRPVEVIPGKLPELAFIQILYCSDADIDQTWAGSVLPDSGRAYVAALRQGLIDALTPTQAIVGTRLSVFNLRYSQDGQGGFIQENNYTDNLPLENLSTQLYDNLEATYAYTPNRLPDEQLGLVQVLRDEEANRPEDIAQQYTVYKYIIYDYGVIDGERPGQDDFYGAVQYPGPIYESALLDVIREQNIMASYWIPSNVIWKGTFGLNSESNDRSVYPQMDMDALNALENHRAYAWTPTSTVDQNRDITFDVNSIRDIMNFIGSDIMGEIPLLAGAAPDSRPNSRHDQFIFPPPIRIEL